MFKNFWYAVEFSADVKVGSPMKVKLLGQQLVVYRKPSDGKVVAMSDLCVHRGAALSAGTLKGDCIVCPYHGWEYGPDGAVQKIPAHPDKGLPRKARIDSYPVQEKYMMIWVFMGDLPEEERPPIPDWSAVDDTENYRAVTGSFLWHSNYERILENGVDVAHPPFVHGGVFGNPEKPEVPDFELEESPWHCKISVKLNPPASKGLWGMITPNRTKDLSKRPLVPVSTTWWLPNMILLEVDTPIGALKIFDVNIPIDEETTLVKYIALRSFFKGAWADRDARRRVVKVLKEDRDSPRHRAPRAAAVRPVRRTPRQERLQLRALPPSPQGAARDGLGRRGQHHCRRGHGGARGGPGHPESHPQGGARAGQRVELQGGPLARAAAVRGGPSYVGAYAADPGHPRRPR